MDFSDLREQLRLFNFKEVFLWLQIAASHPANLLYSTRFDVLTVVLLSIREQEFEGNSFTREQFDLVLKFAHKSYGRMFIQFEDFEPFEQLKIIPYFFDRKKWNFFYGGLERPYEYLRQFHNMYFYSQRTNQNDELDQIRSAFRVSLEFQDALLKEIIGKEESNIKANEVYVPSQKYFEEVLPLFEISNQQKRSLKGMKVLECGSFFGQLSDLEDKILTCGLFETFRVQYMDKGELFIWPGRHIETLFAFANKLIRESGKKSEIGDEVRKNSIKLLKRFCAQFFTIRGVLLDIYSAQPSEKLTGPVDMIGVVDGGKVILFKVVKPDYDLEITECIKETINSLQRVKENINKEDIVGFSYFNYPDKLAGVPTSVIEIFTIAVLTRTNLDMQIMRASGIKEDEHTRIFNIIDLQAMFEILPSTLSFVKFLRNDWEFHKETRVLTTDYLDRFAYYMENGECYPRHGKTMSAIMFASHWWSDYYNQKLYKKYNDDIHELIERHFPRKFNYIKKAGDKIYNVADTAFLDAGVAIKFPKTLIFVSLPKNLYYCEEEEVRSVDFLSNLYSYYFDKFNVPLSEFLELNEIRLGGLYTIWILPVSYVKREKINYLKTQVDKVNQNNPVVVISGRVVDMLNLRTCIMYKPEYLTDVFGSKDNSGERYCFGKLIKSLLMYFMPSMTESEIEAEVNAFLNEHLPVGIKAYSYETQPIENPKVDEYRNYQELNKAECGRVDREIARYLANSKIDTGEYGGEKAGNLLWSICEFLQDRLESEIKKYDKKFLYYTYQQLEYIEGKRRRQVAQAGLHMSKYTEFDVAERNLEETMIIGKSAVAVRHIVTTILKVGCNGNKVTDTEGWNYIHSLSWSIQDISGMYECVRYNILSRTIRITDLFEVKYIEGEEVFDQYKFYRIEAEKRVESAKEKYINLADAKRKMPQASKDLSNFLIRLDKAFESEYGFKYQDMLVVIYSLGKCDIPNVIYSPLNILSMDEVVRYLKYMIIEDCPSEECIRKILEFISLDFKSYRKEEKLFYSQLLRKKERLNLCPVIRVRSNKYVFGNEMCLGAARLWSNFVREGSFPYRVDESSPINEVIEKYRRILDKKLEQQAAEIISELLGPENVESNIHNFKRLSRNFPKNPSCGEIDIIAVKKTSKTMFLFDAKNRPRRIRPYDIKQDIDTFLKGKRSYLSKLVAKERFINENLAEVLRYFSINDVEGWRIKKAFIVAQHYQVAHYKKKSVEFVEIEGLKSYISSVSDLE